MSSQASKQMSFEAAMSPKAAVTDRRMTAGARHLPKKSGVNKIWAEPTRGGSHECPDGSGTPIGNFATVED